MRPGDAESATCAGTRYRSYQSGIMGPRRGFRGSCGTIPSHTARVPFISLLFEQRRRVVIRRGGLARAAGLPIEAHVDQSELVLAFILDQEVNNHRLGYFTIA